MTATQQIARFVTRYDPADLTSELIEACGRALIDTFCAAIAGRREPASVLALRYAQSSGAGADAPHCRAVYWGTGQWLPLELAALCNGVAGHVLDYDDVTSALRGHPSIAMFPALVALAEALDASGRDFVAAYVCGFEVICKLSNAMAVNHYAKGWHSTSTIGCIGAAVACAKLLNLDEKKVANAVGLAVSQAAGSRANFGTHAKSFQAGHSNASGLRAALLAREGFDSSVEILEGAFGYLSLYGNGESLREVLSTLSDGPMELVARGIEVKKYPLCYATHRALDGILDLREELDLELTDVQTVHVRTSAGALTPLIHTRPKTGLEAKFSMQYAVTAALLDGKVGLASFIDEAVLRDQAQTFFPRVTSDDSQSGSTFPRWTELTLQLANGHTVQKRVDALRGSAQMPLTLSELRAKAADCIEWGHARADVDALIDKALRLDRIAFREWRQAAPLEFN